jgi:peroxiredoxin
MRYQKRHSLRAILAALLIAAVTVAASEDSARFKTPDGATVTLEQFTGQGKWLVVKIWASNCHVCNQTAHEIVALSNHRKHDIQVVGIAVDADRNRPGVLAFIERHALNYPVLFDDGRGAEYIYRRGVQRKWGGWTPTYLVYSPQGELVAQHIGAVAEKDVVAFVDSYPSASRPAP